MECINFSYWWWLYCSFSKLDGSAPEAYLLIKLDRDRVLRLCHCYPNDLLKNTEYLFLQISHAPHLITDLCSLLFLEFRLLQFKSLSVLASAQWHKINPHIKKKNDKTCQVAPRDGKKKKASFTVIWKRRLQHSYKGQCHNLLIFSMQPELYFWECCYPRQSPRSGGVPGEHPVLRRGWVADV